MDDLYFIKKRKSSKKSSFSLKFYTFKLGSVFGSMGRSPAFVEKIARIMENTVDDRRGVTVSPTGAYIALFNEMQMRVVF